MAAILKTRKKYKLFLMLETGIELLLSYLVATKLDIEKVGKVSQEDTAETTAFISQSHKL